MTRSDWGSFTRLRIFVQRDQGPRGEAQLVDGGGLLVGAGGLAPVDDGAQRDLGVQQHLPLAEGHGGEQGVDQLLAVPVVGGAGVDLELRVRVAQCGVPSLEHPGRLGPQLVGVAGEAHAAPVAVLEDEVEGPLHRLGVEALPVLCRHPRRQLRHRLVGLLSRQLVHVLDQEGQAGASWATAAPGVGSSAPHRSVRRRSRRRRDGPSRRGGPRRRGRRRPRCHRYGRSHDSCSRHLTPNRHRRGQEPCWWRPLPRRPPAAQVRQTYATLRDTTPT
jgi:hypothetical protein